MTTETRATATRERPILFSGPMVRAILDGRKTQTRRVIKPQPTSAAVMADPLADLRAAGIPLDGLSEQRFAVWMTDERDDHREFKERGVRCPYGAPGDRLWCITIRPVREYETRYGVGDDGNVYRIDGPEPRRMRVALTSKGYECVTLCRDGEKHTASVHRLVFEAFYGSPTVPGEVRHLDGDKRNNLPENLDWGSGAQNWSDRRAQRRGIHDKHHAAKLTWADVQEIRQSSDSQRVVARRFGISQSTVGEIRTGKTWADVPEAVAANLPRWASRLTLEITDVRVQRVQEITDAEALAEGVYPILVDDKNPLRREAFSRSETWGPDGADREQKYVGVRDAFAALWDSLNAKRGHGWDANPWVWALTFHVLPSTPPGAGA